MNTKIPILPLVLCAGFFTSTAAFGGTVRNWTGAAGDNYLGTANNWNPAAVPSSSANDTLQWDGTQAGSLVLTNGLSGFDSNPGFYINVLGTQVGSVSLVESNTATGRIRLNGTNTFNLANGAGGFSFGNGGATLLPIALAGRGNGETHPFTNNSANTVTFDIETFFIMGGGGSHTMLFGGSGNFLLKNTFQPQNSSALQLNLSGSGTVTLLGGLAAGTTYSGSYGNVTVRSGTLVLGGANALGNGNTLVMAGGNLDSSVPGLVNAGNNPQTWSGNFGFLGTQSLDLGFGPVTMSGGGRIVTVNANTLTVQGGISGTGYSLTKAGAGTLVLNGGNSYTGGTVVSNGVLQLGSASAIPGGSVAAASVTVYGTLDLNGNAPMLSSLTGTGIVDSTAAAATPMLTVGANDASSTFAGSIRNTSGSLSLTKTGMGTLTLSGASTYSGGTLISSGTLLVANSTGSATGSGTVTVSAGATLGGAGTIGGNVDWSQSGSLALFTVTSSGGPNTTPLAVSGSVSLSGNAVTVNIPGGIPLGVGTYTLMTYNNTGSSGSFAATPTYTGAGVAAGTTSTITTSGGVVTLNVVQNASGVLGVWINDGGGNWSTAANWSSNPNVPHAAGDSATLGVGSAFTTVTLDSSESVGQIIFTNDNSFAIADGANVLTFDNQTKGASVNVDAGTSNAINTAVSLNDSLAISMFPGVALALSNNITGTGPASTVNVSGAGTLALSGNNTYGPGAGAVGTAVSGGVTLALGNNNALGTGDLAISGSTILAQTALTAPNNVILSNTVTLNNNGNNVSLPGTISGNGALVKNSAGTLTLSGVNTYTGDTTINAGTLRLGSQASVPGGSGYGNLNVNATALFDLNGNTPTLNGLSGSGTVDSLVGGSLTLTLGESGSFATFTGTIQNSAGTLAVVKDGSGNQTLAGTNTYTGGTTINAGLLRVGNGNTNTAGSLIAVGLGTGPVVDSGTLEFNLVGTNVFTNAISGMGTLNVANTGLNLFLTGPNTFSGNISVNSGSLWVTNPAALGTGPKTVIVTGGGNSLLTQLHLAGNITLDSSIGYQLSYLGGVLINESGNNTLQGDIALPYGGGNAYVVVKSGFLTLAGNVASDGNANGRTLQLGGAGNGLFSGVASDNAQTLGGLLKSDSGTWTVSGINTSLGTATANGGILVLNGHWAGPVNVNSGGTLAGTGSADSTLTVNAGGNFVPGGYGSIGTFTVVTNLTLSGTMYASLNKSLAQTHTFVNVGGATANSGSSLVVSNLGPALVVGDTFQLFSQPVTNGNLVTIVAPAGVAFTNNLAVDGTIQVVPAVSTTRTNITATVSGNQLTLSWPADHTGWHLQGQTNAPGTGITTNWVTITGTDATNSYSTTIDPAKGSVFYRMVYP